MKTKRNTSSGNPNQGRWQAGMRRFFSPFRMVVILLTLSAAFGGHKLAAQGVGISEVAIPDPHSSSILELRSSLRGFLAPRMTTTQRNAIAAPAQGLLVYDTDTKSFWYFDVIWKSVIGSNTPGGPNQLLGMNLAGDENEYKTLNGTTNQVIEGNCADTCSSICDIQNALPCGHTSPVGGLQKLAITG